MHANRTQFCSEHIRQKEKREKSQEWRVKVPSQKEYTRLYNVQRSTYNVQRTRAMSEAGRRDVKKSNRQLEKKDTHIKKTNRSRGQNVSVSSR